MAEMRICFSTISCPDYSLVEVARAVDDYGYDAVELYALAGKRLTAERLTDELPAIKRDLGRVPIACINSWATLSDPAAAARAEQEERIVRTMELAAELGCPLVKSFGGELPSGWAEPAVFDYMAGSIGRVVARGRELGVALVVETHDGFCSARRLAELLRRVDDDFFGALWDVHHPYRVGESVPETDALIGARVRHAHVKDAVRDGAGWRFTLPGDGELPVEQMLSRLRARSYDGFVSVDWEKMRHPEIEGPEVALPRFASVLRSYE